VKVHIFVFNLISMVHFNCYRLRHNLQYVRRACARKDEDLKINVIMEVPDVRQSQNHLSVKL